MKKKMWKYPHKAISFLVRDWKGQDKLLKFAISLLCLSCRRGYFMEILPLSVLAEVSWAK